jgi:hypothetical protein
MISDFVTRRISEAAAWVIEIMGEEGLLSKKIAGSV